VVDRSRTADALRTFADEMAEHADGGPVGGAAQAARNVATRLDRRRGRTLAYDARRFVRHRPWVLVAAAGGGLLVGLVVAAALARRRQEELVEDEFDETSLGEGRAVRSPTWMSSA
jgi:ElaB/YqjD/DUF883 family membrane-anchored ribosome-binding protein